MKLEASFEVKPHRRYITKQNKSSTAEYIGNMMNLQEAIFQFFQIS